ncbi:MAG: hypothetical protein ACT4OI_08375 [Methanobacteriota archaeon]
MFQRRTTGLGAWLAVLVPARRRRAAPRDRVGVDGHVLAARVEASRVLRTMTSPATHMVRLLR